MTASSSAQIDALTGARFFAASWVLVMHFAVTGALGPVDDSLHGYWLQFMIATGGAGVGFFYMLSGFVLAHAYDAEFEKRHAPGLIRRYWIARIARIYPTYLFALLLTTASASCLGYLGASPWKDCQLQTCGVAWALSAIPLQAWFPDTLIQQVWNAPGWSISVETLFYLLFPFIIAPVLSLARQFGWRSIVLFWAVQNTAFYLLAHSIDSLPAATREGFQWWLERLPLLRLPEFAMGIALLGIWRNSSAQQAGPRHSTPWLILLILLLCGLWFLPTPTALPPALKTLLAGKAYLLAAPLFALLILGIAQASIKPPQPLTRLLGSAPLRLLGQASYALYILHWAVLQFLFVAMHSQGPPSPGIGYLAMALAMALAIGTHFLLERPCQRAINRFQLTPGKRHRH